MAEGLIVIDCATGQAGLNIGTEERIRGPKMSSGLIGTVIHHPVNASDQVSLSISVNDTGCKYEEQPL